MSMLYCTDMNTPGNKFIVLFWAPTQTSTAKFHQPFQQFTVLGLFLLDALVSFGVIALTIVEIILYAECPQSNSMKGQWRGSFWLFFFFKKKKTSWLRDYWVWLRINCIANVWLVCALSPQFGLFNSILLANSHLSHINYQQKSVTHSKEHAVYSVPHATYTCDCLVCLWSTGKREHAVPLTQTAWPVCSLDFRPLISVRIWIHDLPWSPSSTQKHLTKPCMQWEPSAISTLCPGFTNSLHSL